MRILETNEIVDCGKLAMIRTALKSDFMVTISWQFVTHIHIVPCESSLSTGL